MAKITTHGESWANHSDDLQNKYLKKCLTSALKIVN